jgi:hypothetical protein
MTMPFPILGVDVEITGLSASLAWEVMGVAENIELGDEGLTIANAAPPSPPPQDAIPVQSPLFFLNQ